MNHKEITMNVDKHDFVHDFPEHKETIHKLKADNAHFAKLHQQYHDLTHEIHGIETNDNNTSDDYLNTLKEKRVKLKDELYQMIKKA